MSDGLGANNGEHFDCGVPIEDFSTSVSMTTDHRQPATSFAVRQRSLARARIAPRFPHHQTQAAAELVARLKFHGLNLTVYSGYTIKARIERNIQSIDYILTHIDLLLDGPFLRVKRSGLSEYRRSRNQRLINLAELRGNTDSNQVSVGSTFSHRFEIKPLLELEAFQTHGSTK